jgi:hypothetical protein
MASISSGFSMSPQAGIAFLPCTTELTKRALSSGGNLRRSKDDVPGLIHSASSARPAHQPGLHRDAREVRSGDGLLVATYRKALR